MDTSARAILVRGSDEENEYYRAFISFRYMLMH